MVGVCSGVHCPFPCVRVNALIGLVTVATTDLGLVLYVASIGVEFADVRTD